MNGIALMIEEHKLIKRMLKVMRRASYNLLKNDKYSDSDFRKMIDLITYTLIAVVIVINGRCLYKLHKNQKQ